MSLLSREQVTIGFSPAQLSALCRRGRRQPPEERLVPLAGNGEALWENALEALEILLDDKAWGGREVTLILSNHYVRYAVIPKSRILAPARLNDLARIVFREIFGDLARDWALRVSPARQTRTLASGVPQTLLTAISAICEERCTLRSIQPGLMPVFNRVRANLDRHSGTLALLEPGRITLAAIEQGQWLSIDSRAGDGDHLPERLAEVHALSGHPPGGRLWLCDLTGKAIVPDDPAWLPERLSAGRPANNGMTTLADWGFQ